MEQKFWLTKIQPSAQNCSKLKVFSTRQIFTSLFPLHVLYIYSYSLVVLIEQ